MKSPNPSGRFHNPCIPNMGKFLSGTVVAFGLLLNAFGGVPNRPNIVIFAVDDMDYDSMNITGNPLPGLTPHMDALAGEGLLFERAHINASICQPSRQSMMTGLHSHNNRTLGFVPVPKGIPSLPELLAKEGYYTENLSKGRDYSSFPWSQFIEGYGTRGMSRDGAQFAASLKKAIETSKQNGQPLFITVNTSDPHRPFAGSDDEKRELEELQKKFPDAAARGDIWFPPAPNVCSPENAFIPGYNPDLPDVRKEWAQYYNTVKRADDTLGLVLDVLREEGVDKNTLFIFWSDNGAPFPMSKTGCYPFSTHTPLMVRWPGVIPPGAKDSGHFVSTLDIMPTLLEIVGCKDVPASDGRSFLSLLTGGRQENRDEVFTTSNFIVPGMQVYPIRGLHTADYSLIFNAWSDGRRVEKNEPMNGLTMAAIENATDPEIKKRCDFIRKRTRWELYNTTKDLWCLQNLADDPASAKTLETMKQRMERRMKSTNDPLLPYFLGKPGYPPEWDVRSPAIAGKKAPDQK